MSTEVTTPSLEAWKSYSAAVKAFQRRAQSAEVISLLKRAIEIDPEFAWLMPNWAGRTPTSASPRRECGI